MMLALLMVLAMQLIEFIRPVTANERHLDAGTRHAIAVLLGAIAAMITIDPTLAENADVLELESSIPLPDTPTALAWTHDGKKLAMRSFNLGNLYIVDLETHSVSPPIAEHYKGYANLSFSPDGAFLAVFSERGLQLLSTKDWQAVAQVDLSFVKNLHGTGTMAFTPQGQSLWMACHRDALGPIKADAIAFNVPDLKFIGSYESTGRISRPGPHPRENDSVNTTDFGIDQGQLSMTNVIYHYTGKNLEYGEAEIKTYVRSILLGERGPQSELPPVSWTRT